MSAADVDPSKAVRFLLSVCTFYMFNIDDCNLSALPFCSFYKYMCAYSLFRKGFQASPCSCDGKLLSLDLEADLNPRSEVLTACVNLCPKNSLYPRLISSPRPGVNFPPDTVFQTLSHYFVYTGFM